MVISYCTLLMQMCFSSNPQTIYRRAWTKCPGPNATIPGANLLQGGRGEHPPRLSLALPPAPGTSPLGDEVSALCSEDRKQGDVLTRLGRSRSSAPRLQGREGCGCSPGTPSHSPSPPRFWQGWQGKQAASSPGVPRAWSHPRPAPGRICGLWVRQYKLPQCRFLLSCAFYSLSAFPLHKCRGKSVLLLVISNMLNIS